MIYSKYEKIRQKKFFLLSYLILRLIIPFFFIIIFILFLKYFYLIMLYFYFVLFGVCVYMNVIKKLSITSKIHFNVIFFFLKFFLIINNLIFGFNTISWPHPFKRIFNFSILNMN